MRMCEDTKQLLRDDVTRPMCFPTGEVKVVRQVVGRIESEDSEIVFFVRFADCFADHLQVPMCHGVSDLAPHPPRR